MKHAYTEEQLIQFIYGECDILERLEINDAIENHLVTKDAYLSLLDAYKMLPKVKFSPSRKSVENIIAYSKNACAASC